MSSPENLDEALVAASPVHWIAFLSFGGLCAAAVAWGVLGSVPTRVTAEGILLQRGSEVFSASAEGDGELVEIKVALGDRVRAGETVAVLDQDVVVKRLELARQSLVSAQQRLQASLEDQDADTVLRAQLAAQQRASIKEKIRNAEARVANLEVLVRDMEALFERGFIQRTRLLARQNELIEVRELIADLRNNLVHIDVKDRERAEFWTEIIKKAEQEIERNRDDVENHHEQLKRVGTVEAPISGTVTEISASLGDVLRPGTPVIRIVSEATEMDALLFLSPAKGKLVKPGLIANIEPSVAKKEEFGTIIASVRSVSHLPMSAAAIQAMLHNQKLVEQFTKNGSPVAIRADLRETGEGSGRFEWTGGTGPEWDIEPGTLTRATITVRSQSPVSLILPFLKSLVGA